MDSHPPSYNDSDKKGANDAALSIQDLKKIASYFPIGERVHYFPEYQQNMLLRSVVLGYEINGHVIFKQNQLEIMTTNSSGHVTLHIDDKEYHYSELTSFCVILPGKAGEEGKLNYPSKASLGSLGQFRNGNAITLTARFENSGVVMVECNVRESTVPKSGFYRNHRLSLLEVVATSVEIKEQRTHHRLQTSIPVSLKSKTMDSACAAMLLDYSELHLRLKFGEESQALAKLKKDASVTMTLNLELWERVFVISGKVMRKNNDGIVMTMQEIRDDHGDYRSFELMDALDLKACLLQHPNTE